MTLAVGIDLGTTNSAIAVRRLTTEILSNQEGEFLTPSCVLLLPDQNVVGRAALDLSKLHPKNSVLSIKRLIGRDFAEVAVQNFIKPDRCSYDVETDPSEPDSIFVKINRDSYRPEDLSALILKKLLQDAEQQLGSKPTQAVVTVPAYFSDRQKFCTRAAAQQAGLTQVKLLPEPTAAAIAFGLDSLSEDDSLSLMVFDLGGGTFDMSVLSISGGHFMEIAKGGDMWLGGDDIDQLLYDQVIERVKNKTGLSHLDPLIHSLSANDQARFTGELRRSCEQAKRELSQNPEAQIECFGILRDEQGDWLDIDEVITREEFEQWLQPFMDRLEQLTRALVAEIYFEVELIDQVLMVGGSSLIPAVQALMGRIFGGDKVRLHPRPMFAVAEGAAIWAQQNFSSEEVETRLEIMHSVTHDYYLQLAEGKRQRLVERNSPLPCFVDEQLQFIHEDQELACLRVLNEVEGVFSTVGELWLSRSQLGQLATKEKPVFNLRFEINEDNIIHMRAWPLDHSERCIQGVIARGGLVPKLYTDLESALRKAFSKTDQKTQSMPSYQSVARIIVENIQKVVDPVSAQVNADQKRKVLAQLKTLDIMLSSAEDPFQWVGYCQALQSFGLRLMSQGECARFSELATHYLQAAQDFTQWSRIMELRDSLERCLQSLNHAGILDSLVRTEIMAEQRHERHPSEARRLRLILRNSLDVWLSPGEDEGKRIAEELVNHELAKYSIPTATPRFYRDVQRLEKSTRSHRL